MIDIFFLIFAGYGFFLGFYRGIIKTVFTILSYVFGLLAAFKLSPAMTRFLESVSGIDNPFMYVAGFLVAFFGTMLLIRFLAKAISQGMETANVNIVNQMAGGAFLAAVMTLVYSLLLWFGVRANIVKDEHTRNSLTYSMLEKYPENVWTVMGKLKPTLMEFWDHSVDFMDKIEKVSVERTESDPNVYNIDD
ncbi:MAG TPA: CvpA family protein [Saprospiraceae bacterium]|nr:CvpA family protein [Saprospiraceae bacterium]HMP24123.1 CvpA family protein [Saprospiraceae bacterium]